MKLAELKQRSEVEIVNIVDPRVRALSFRFGISAGSRVLCWPSIAQGPFILEKNFQRLALSYSLAQEIEVRVIKEE
ncbi:FeoA family protein [Fuchsiella alkaliacetigena]|uniref:FeoA family protein n=1 Tax=Fuchsiella alkaliacetigena TaxID=957042 RepID=UPI00200B1250|nr:FeoA family protein [Fuchsiella alkaliacetigena]MCK8825275.1 ferrous iron transport protein A [Fuchsiella alkaliacetigena]